MDTPVSIDAVRAHPALFVYLDAANAHLRSLGYTEHGRRHAGIVSHNACRVLAVLEHPARTQELAEIAGLLHDIGNVVNREQHGPIGALMAKDLLLELGLGYDELAPIMNAIGNHEEQRGHTSGPIAAALVLADKADVHRSRVQEPDPAKYDIHDRVNSAATESSLIVEDTTVTLDLTIDTTIASVMEYFEIFLARMVMCRQAAEVLDCRFALRINQFVL